jgi:hypothetical protein
MYLFLQVRLRLEFLSSFKFRLNLHFITKCFLRTNPRGFFFLKIEMASKRKRQTNLFSFLGKPDYSIPRFFSLNNSHVATFTKDKPSNSPRPEIYEINWKDQLTVLKIYTSSSSKIRIPMFNPSYPLPYLKSHLQKCIRRRRVDLAVKTALCMINLDPISVYRSF